MKRMLTILLAAAFCVALFAGVALAAEKPLKIVFVCTGNTCRSPMAEGIAKKVSGEEDYNFEIISRGTDLDPDELVANLNARVVMIKRGVKLDGHKSMAMGAEEARDADLILTMTDGHRKNVLKLFPDAESRTFTLIEYVTGKPGNISDPWGMNLDEYEKTASQLDELIPAALAKFADR